MQEADIGVGPFFITNTRSEVVDYTVPMHFDYYRILGSQGQVEVDPWSFRLPLDLMVWTGAVLTILILSAIMALLSWTFGFSTNDDHCKNTDAFGFISVFLQQSELQKCTYFRGIPQ